MFVRILTGFCAMLVFAAITVSAPPSRRDQNGEFPPDTQPSEENTDCVRFYATHGRFGPTTAPVEGDKEFAGFYIALTPAQRERFAKRVESLQLGDSLHHVKEVLGEPTDEGAGDANCFPPRTHRSWLANYWVAENQKNLSTDGKDVTLLLSFDWQGRLEMVEPVRFPLVQARRTADVYQDEAIPGWWRFPKRKYLTTQPTSNPATGRSEP